jgi:hypothetical protein
VKKVGIALVISLVVAFGLLLGLTNSGLKLFGTSIWTANQDIEQLETMARSFLQDLQYKDFADAAKYHTFLDRDKVDISKLIHDLFAVKPETLNIRDFDITRVTVDPDGRRARTFFTANLEFLNTAQGDKPNKEKQVEGILYWEKRPAIEGVAVAPADPTAPAAGHRPRNRPAPSTTDVTTAAPGTETEVAFPPVATEAPTATATAPAPAPASGAERWFMQLEDSLH